MSACGVDGPKPSLPASIIIASRRASSRIAGATSRSWITTSAAIQRLARLQGQQLGIARTRADQIDMAVASRSPAGAGPASRPAPRSPRPRRRSAQAPRADACRNTPPRNRGARGPSAARRPRRGTPCRCAPAGRDPRAAAPPDRALIRRARTGAAPSVPMAMVTGSRSTMAGVMKSGAARSSTILTSAPVGPRKSRRRGRPRRRLRRRRRPAPRRRRHRLQRRGDQGQPTLGGPGGDLGRGIGGEHRQTRLGLQDQPQLGHRRRAAAGHTITPPRAARKIGKCCIASGPLVA